MCFSPYLGLGCGERGGGGPPKRLVHNLLMQFSPWAAQKLKFPRLIFFDTVTTQNDHPRYVKHVLARSYVVFTLFWVCIAWGRFSARWAPGRITSHRFKKDQSQAAPYRWEIGADKGKQLSTKALCQRPPSTTSNGLPDT